MSYLQLITQVLSQKLTNSNLTTQENLILAGISAFCNLRDLKQDT